MKAFQFLFSCSLALHFMFSMAARSHAQPSASGINISGMERVWENPEFKSRKIINEIKSSQSAGYTAIRLPLDMEYLLKSDKFLREVRKTVKYARSHEIDLVLAYFGHDLSDQNAVQKSEIISDNWKTLLKGISGKNSQLFIELANEPVLSPQVWERIWPDMVQNIRQVDSNIPIIIGATNFNSLFELSRTSPPDLKNLIFTFHYYEPYIFTHQGTTWTGDQNATTGIPYPFLEGKMPAIDPKAKNTSGEVNLKDYYLTGNKVAIKDKIEQIANWAAQNQVTLWCTEYGVTINADPISRATYLRDVKEVLEENSIPGYVWEWDGNFGVKGLRK